MVNKTIKMEDLFVGKQKVEDAWVAGEPSFVRVKVGRGEHPICVDIKPQNIEVYFHTEKLEWQRGKGPQSKEYRQTVIFQKSKEGEFQFYFGNTFAMHSKFPVKVKMTSDGLYFPEIFRPEEIEGLNRAGANIGKNGPNIKEVDQVLKVLKKGDYKNFQPNPFEYSTAEPYRYTEIEGTLKDVSKFRKQIEWVASLPKDLERLQENRWIKQLLENAKRQSALREKGAFG
ncbi:MAG: hypothetical protein Sv326_0626 [Candidatus Fermentimicrarchaeum limneticum]|uniref:Uncharacterized protein n=1 Tax=Fermentimicrarchaeum limneticum TaxID=2795018 RepID=A0A7D6BSZ5_FERL1|nr:MAG: hypothetical protein Sv326_0626 [Candidatus Fermentimicrarchaeum limneticum]